MRGHGLTPSRDLSAAWSYEAADTLLSSEQKCHCLNKLPIFGSSSIDLTGGSVKLATGHGI